MFQGFTQETIGFLLSIRFNNNKEFFEENRALYEHSVKKPLRDLAEDLAPCMIAIDPQIDTRPARVCSRIRRDTRFTRDKSPYRDYIWLSWRYAGEARAESFGMYWDASPEGMSWGCGTYGEDKPLMDALRERMRTRPGELIEIINAPGFRECFEFYGPEFKRFVVPEDVPEQLRFLYRKKGFYVQCVEREEDYPLLFTPQLPERIAREFVTLAPLYHYMRQVRGEIRIG